MKKLVSMLLALTLVLIMGCAQAEDSTSETTAVRIGALKGPTSMGMAQMLKDAADGNSNYQFTIAGAPDEITALANWTLRLCRPIWRACFTTTPTAA